MCVCVCGEVVMEWEKNTEVIQKHNICEIQMFLKCINLKIYLFTFLLNKEKNITFIFKIFHHFHWLWFFLLFVSIIK